MRAGCWWSLGSVQVVCRGRWFFWVVIAEKSHSDKDGNLRFIGGNLQFDSGSLRRFPGQDFQVRISRSGFPSQDFQVKISRSGFSKSRFPASNSHIPRLFSKVLHIY